MSIGIYSKPTYREREVRAPEYKGKKRFLVIRDGYGAAHVFAPDMASAIYTAAKHWGLDPRKREIQQGLTARKG